MVVHLSVFGTGFALAAFGMAYNWLIGWMERRGYFDGNAALTVVGGTLITLIGVGALDLVVDWNAGLLGLFCFSCSGAPMVIGSMIRHMRLHANEREQERAMAAAELKRGLEMSRSIEHD